MAVFGREEAIRRFSGKLLSDNRLRDRLWTLSGFRLVCHCKLTQRCHREVIVREFRSMFLNGFDRDDPDAPPSSSRVPNYMSRLRDEPPNEEEGSSADEGVLPKGSGWRGRGDLMSVGVGTFRGKFAMDKPSHPPVAGRFLRGDIRIRHCDVHSRPASWIFRGSSVH